MKKQYSTTFFPDEIVGDKLMKKRCQLKPDEIQKARKDISIQTRLIFTLMFFVIVLVFPYVPGMAENFDRAKHILLFIDVIYIALFVFVPDLIVSELFHTVNQKISISIQEKELVFESGEKKQRYNLSEVKDIFHCEGKRAFYRITIEPDNRARKNYYVPESRYEFIHTLSELTAVPINSFSGREWGDETETRFRYWNEDAQFGWETPIKPCYADYRYCKTMSLVACRCHPIMVALWVLIARDEILAIHSMRYLVVCTFLCALLPGLVMTIWLCIRYDYGNYPVGFDIREDGFRLAFADKTVLHEFTDIKWVMRDINYGDTGENVECFVMRLHEGKPRIIEIPLDRKEAVQILAQKAGVQIGETRELKKVYRKTRAE